MFSLIIKNNAQNSIETFYYNSRDVALQDSIFYIQNYINVGWNHQSDAIVLQRAKEINDHVINCEYELAFYYFHVYESLGPNEVQYSIEYIPVIDSDALIPDLFDYILPDDEIKSDKLAPIKFGAVCRKCRNHSDYANSDNKDGTYICYQCKCFNQIFNSA